MLNNERNKLKSFFLKKIFLILIMYFTWMLY